jgi:hypothetical protein
MRSLQAATLLVAYDGNLLRRSPLGCRHKASSQKAKAINDTAEELGIFNESARSLTTVG